jgi:hypothetical protein
MALTAEQHAALAVVQSMAWASPEDRSTVEREYGLSIEHQSFYLGTPSVEEIRGSYEYGPRGQPLPVHGRHLFHLEQEALLLQKLQRHAPARLEQLCADAGFRWDNDQFSHSDALNLYLFLEGQEIRKVIEVGSGWSSRISASTLRKHGGSLTCIDPAPRADLQDLDATFLPRRIQELDPEMIIGSLKAGDLLFIDSSHTLKPGSDCLYLYTRIVPYLQPGVHVHIHDLYLPYARPMQQVLHERRFWHEDYAVLLLMLGGVLKPILSNYLLCSHPETAALMMQPPAGLHKGGASIYFVVTSGQGRSD